MGAFLCLRWFGFRGMARGVKAIFFSTLVLLATVFTVSAEVSPIRMDVVQKQKTDSKGKANETKSQMRSLDITLQNLSRVNCDNLVVKYWFFARNEKTGSTSVFKKGERKVSVAAGKKEVVESEQVNSTYTEDHYDVQKGKGKSSAPSAKKVEGSGERVLGYGVRVLEGERVIQEFFSPQGLKEKL